ncbi:G2/mitotic-specific cyclin-4 [Verticillium dahliae VDG2]|nr:G2/mitotic-specific cyclin-4 [Verticillium dahliae VDG2]
MADDHNTVEGDKSPPHSQQQSEHSEKKEDTVDYGKVRPFPSRDHRELRKRVWVKPRPMSDDEKKRIIANYEADFHDFEKDAEEAGILEEGGSNEGSWDVDEDNPHGIATKRVHFLRADLEAGLSPEEKALARRQQLEQQTGEEVSDDGWFAIWSHETANDGMIERLRRWAAGRDSVPVAYFNAFIQKTYAATYDAITEEDRLRAQKLSMQIDYDARLEQDQKDYDTRVARSRADAMAAAEVALLTKMIQDTLEQILEESRLQDEPPSVAFAKAHAEASKALTDRTRAEEAVDETTNRHIPPNSQMMGEKDGHLRTAMNSLHAHLGSQPSNAASLYRLVDALLTSSGGRQESRQGLFDTQERLRQNADERAKNALRVQNLGFQHFIELEQQLHHATATVAQVQKDLRDRDDERKNLWLVVHSMENSMMKQAVVSINKYRRLVAQRVRNNLSEQSHRLLTEANKLERSIYSFEQLSEVLQNTTLPPPADIATRITDELTRIASLFESAPDSIRSLASGLLDQEIEEESKSSERSAEADTQAKLQVLEDEVKQLSDDKRRLEAQMLSIKDTTDISALLDAQDADRRRADECQREAQELHSQLRESRLQGIATAREVQTRISAMQRSLNRAHAPSKVLERQAEQAREECRTAELRAEIAEAKVKDLMATLQEVSGDCMKILPQSETETTSPTATATAAEVSDDKCTRENHRGQIERLTSELEKLKTKKEGAASKASFAARRELENELRIKTLDVERAKAELIEVRESMAVQVLAGVDERTSGIWKELVASRIAANMSNDEVGEEVRSALERSLDAHKVFNTKLLDSNCELRRLLSEHNQAYARLQLARSGEALSGEDFRGKLVELQQEVAAILGRGEDDVEAPATTTWGQGQRQSVMRIQQVFAGRPSAEEAAAGLMSRPQIEAYWKYLSFQRQRAQAVSALRHADWHGAQARLDKLDKWFEGAGPWHQFYRESEIQGSLAFVRAFCLARTSGDMRKSGDVGWTVVRDASKQELERARNICYSDGGDGVDESDILSGEETRYVQVWRNFGTRAEHELDALFLRGNDGNEGAEGDE